MLQTETEKETKEQDKKVSDPLLPDSLIVSSQPSEPPSDKKDELKKVQIEPREVGWKKQKETKKMKVRLKD